MSGITNILSVMLKGFQRDRIVYAVLGVALLLICLVPAFSLFSMRQVQELSITLSLAVISFVLLVLTTIVGASSIWSDVERRYTTSVLGLPLARHTYVLGKFCGMAVLLMGVGLFLGLVSLAAIYLAAGQYPSVIPIHWGAILIAIGFCVLKYLLLAAVALVFSTLSTSFFLPFFCTIALYFAGSASQNVYEYVTGSMGTKMNSFSKVVIKTVYYVIPNFSAFDFKVQAIYGLPLVTGDLLFTLAYFFVYLALLVSVAVWVFTRRELP